MNIKEKEITQNSSAFLKHTNLHSLHPHHYRVKRRHTLISYLVGCDFKQLTAYQGPRGWDRGLKYNVNSSPQPGGVGKVFGREMIA